MYARIAEVTAQSDLQFKMLMAFIEKDLLPKNIAAESPRNSGVCAGILSRVSFVLEINIQRI